MKVAIVGAPVDLGADRRGVDMGPSAIRYADLEAALRASGHTVQDFGNVSVAVPESQTLVRADLKYVDPIVEMANRLAHLCAEKAADGWFTIVLGGDHSISLGSVAGSAAERTLGLIWLDAHGDYNTATSSPSGNIHGMVLSALSGYGDAKLVNIGRPGAKLATRNIVVIGVRSLDSGEQELLRSTDVTVFTMHDVDRMGLDVVMAQAAEIAGSGVDGIHLSLDLDVVDPLQAPGVGTPVLGGLTFRETHLAMELLAETRTLVSMDVVEVNPILDTHNETARLAVQFTLSALGKRIF